MVKRGLKLSKFSLALVKTPVKTRQGYRILGNFDLKLSNWLQIRLVDQDIFISCKIIWMRV